MDVSNLYIFGIQLAILVVLGLQFWFNRKQGQKNAHLVQEIARSTAEQKSNFDSATNLNQLLEANKRSAEDQHQDLLQRFRVSEGVLKLRAIKAIADLGERGAIATEPFEKKFKDERHDFVMRLHLLEALAQINRSQFEKLLLSVAFFDPHPGVLAHSATMAGSLGINRAKEALEKLMREARDEKLPKGRQPSVERACAWALKELQGESESYDSLPRDTGPLFGYILAKAPHVTRDNRFENFHAARKWTGKTTSGIIEGSVIEGEYDIMLKVVAKDLHEFGDLIMNDIQSEDWIHGTHTLLVVNRPKHLHWIRKEELEKPAGGYPAWVMLKIPTGKSAVVVLSAYNIDRVKEAAAVFGDKEVVVKIVESDDGDTVQELADLPYVLDTHTYRTSTGPGRTFNSHCEVRDLFDGLWF